MRILCLIGLHDFWSPDHPSTPVRRIRCTRCGHASLGGF